MSTSAATNGVTSPDAQVKAQVEIACRALAQAAPHHGLNAGAVRLGQGYLRSLFGAKGAPRIGDAKLLELAQAKFAEACLRGELTGMPGQSQSWYAKAEQAARQRRAARASGRPTGRKPATGGTRADRKPARPGSRGPRSQPATFQAATAQTSAEQAASAPVLTPGGSRAVPGGWRPAGTCVKAASAA